MEKIYNRPLKDSNHFLISRDEGSTDWVSYHLIPNRVKVEVKVKVGNEDVSGKDLIETVSITFDYPVDEKSYKSFLKKGVEIYKGKHTDKILGLKIVCNEILLNDGLTDMVEKIFHEISLDILKESNRMKDEVLKTSYKGITKILVHISEDLSKQKLPEFTESF